MKDFLEILRALITTLTVLAIDIAVVIVTILIDLNIGYYSIPFITSIFAVILLVITILVISRAVKDAMNVIVKKGERKSQPLDPNRSPYRHLLMIPICLIIAIIVVVLTYQLEYNYSYSDIDNGFMAPVFTMMQLFVVAFISFVFINIGISKTLTECEQRKKIEKK